MANSQIKVLIKRIHMSNKRVGISPSGCQL